MVWDHCAETSAGELCQLTHLALCVVLALLHAVGVSRGCYCCVEVGDCLADGVHLLLGEPLGQSSCGGCISLGGHQLGSNLDDGRCCGAVGQVYGWGLQELAAS